ncbi:zinc finger BED domain-containing protein RICESLEEPER 2 [Tanacetum coccineum]
MYVYNPSPSLGEGLVVPFFHIPSLYNSSIFPSNLSLTSQPTSHSCSWFDHKITRILQDQTINLNSDDFGHESNEDENKKKNNDNKKNAKKRKRKPSEGIGNLLSECWKYFDPKMERPDEPDGPLIRMAYYDDGLCTNVAIPRIKNTCDSNRFLIAECPTRWNSTYDMLKGPVAHLFYSEILDVDKHLREWEVVPKFKLMVEKMRLKYDKYWGDYKNINHYMYFAVLLDPTMKSEILGYGFRHLMENGCILEENEYEENTPLEFLTDNEKEDKVKQLVYEVETNMDLLALYTEK